MNSIDESLKESLYRVLDYITVLDREVRSRAYQNEQWFIEW